MHLPNNKNDEFDLKRVYNSFKICKNVFSWIYVLCSKRVIFTPVAVLKNYKWCDVVEPNDTILRRLT